MTEDCLNPNCEREVDVVGVCIPCSHGDYNPSVDGIDIGLSEIGEPLENAYTTDVTVV